MQRRKRRKHELTLTTSQSSRWQVFKSPSVGECVEQWERTAVGADVVTAVVPSHLQNLVKLRVLYHLYFYAWTNPRISLREKGGVYETVIAILFVAGLFIYREIGKSLNCCQQKKRNKWVAFANLGSEYESWNYILHR